MSKTDEGKDIAFKFKTYVTEGVADPDVDIMAIDYDDEVNPNLLIRKIRDELVEVVPSVNLGKIHYRTGDADSPKWTFIGYFALRETG